MKLIETPLPGTYVVELEPSYDERGFFARTYCDDQFRVLLPHVAQAGISFNERKGTVRGMHYQLPPYGEAKLVRCTRGAVFDVAIDLQSAQWFGVELRPDNGRMFYVPEGFAHGFQTLEDDSEVSYMISTAYQPQSAAGVRWNDPRFGIRWPLDATMVSDRDRSYPDYVAP